MADLGNGFDSTTVVVEALEPLPTVAFESPDPLPTMVVQVPGFQGAPGPQGPPGDNRIEWKTTQW